MQDTSCEQNMYLLIGWSVEGVLVVFENQRASKPTLSCNVLNMNTVVAGGKAEG